MLNPFANFRYQLGDSLMHKADEKAQEPQHWIVLARIVEENLPGIYQYKLLCRRLDDRSDAMTFPFEQSEMVPHPDGRQSERSSSGFDRYAALREDVDSNVRLGRKGILEDGLDSRATGG